MSVKEKVDTVAEVEEKAREIAESRHVNLALVTSRGWTYTFRFDDTSQDGDNVRPSNLGRLLQATGVFDCWFEAGHAIVKIDADRFLNQ